MATQHVRVNDDLHILIQQCGDKLEVGIAPRGGQPVRLATLDLEPTVIEVRQSDSVVFEGQRYTALSLADRGPTVAELTRHR